MRITTLDTDILLSAANADKAAIASPPPMPRTSGVAHGRTKTTLELLDDIVTNLTYAFLMLLVLVPAIGLFALLVLSLF
jgi:hypothetical protein